MEPRIGGARLGIGLERPGEEPVVDERGASVQRQLNEIISGERVRRLVPHGDTLVNVLTIVSQVHERDMPYFGSHA